MLLSGLFVVHDASRGGENDETELTGGQEVRGPLLQLLNLDIVARGDDTALVDAANELDDDLARATIIDDLELANVSYGVMLVFV